MHTPGSDLAHDVSLANWQTGPNVEWSFQHVEQIVATSAIAASAQPIPLPERDAGLAGLTVAQVDESTLTVAEVMAATDTDGWAVFHRGELVAQAYPRGMQPSTRHLLMSVSKSLVGMIAGILIERGVLDPQRRLDSYIPALVGRGYGDATVRDVLDMRSGIAFSEDYLDPMAEVRLMEQVIDWAPRTVPGLPTTLYDFLAGLSLARPHGGAFEYRSCETNMLGWVCEAASGTHLTTLLSDLIWRPMGAEYDAYIGVDSVGTGMYDGGICASLRDLVRFGHLLLGDGRAVDGTAVVPPTWLADTWAGGADSVQAFAASPTVTLMEGGMYRNQCWFPRPSREVLLCLGIHGQMIYVNRVTGVVAAKLSSWPEPQHAWKLFTTLSAFDAISAALSADSV